MTDEEADQLLGQVMRIVGGLTDTVEKSFAQFADYIADGGQDRVACERILDQLGRQLAEGMMRLEALRHPHTRQTATAALHTAAQRPLPPDGAHAEELPRAALEVLTGLLTLGRHYLVNPHHWPEDVPDIVLAAVRAAGEDPSVVPPDTDG